MKTALWVAFFGALGSVSRFGLGTFIARAAPSRLPAATLFINLVGSLAIGVLMTAAARRGLSDTVRVALATGLLGGFTTMSAFAWESVALFEARDLPRALAYVAATVLGCLLACAAGAALGRLAWR